MEGEKIERGLGCRFWNPLAWPLFHVGPKKTHQVGLDFFGPFDPLDQSHQSMQSSASSSTHPLRFHLHQTWTQCSPTNPQTTFFILILQLSSKRLPSLPQISTAFIKRAKFRYISLCCTYFFLIGSLIHFQLMTYIVVLYPFPSQRKAGPLNLPYHFCNQPEFERHGQMHE